MVARRFAFRLFFRTLLKMRQTGFGTELRPILRDQIFPPRASRAKDKNPAPPLLFRMASAYWVSQAIYVAAKLGIADLLKDGSQSCFALARTTKTDAPSLFRLMRALASVGVFAQLGKDSFALSRLAEPMRSDVPGSLRSMLITIGEIHYQACGNLLYSVQTGSPAFDGVFGTDLFDYLHLNPEPAAVFNRGMTDLSSMLAYAVLMAYDFSGIDSIVDVGGGEGELLRRILKFNPHMKGTVVDMPTVIERPAQKLKGRICERRLSYIAGDFFASVPASSGAYLLCNVVHDWGDDLAIAVLGNCHKAMRKDAKLLLVDMIVPDAPSVSFSKFLDLNMMIMTGGRERTKADFNALLDAADYRITKIVPTLAPQSVIEAIPK